MNFWCVSLSGLLMQQIQLRQQRHKAMVRGGFLFSSPAGLLHAPHSLVAPALAPAPCWPLLEPEPQEIVTPAEGRNLLPQHCCFCPGGCGTCPRVHSTICGELCEDRMGLPRARCNHFQMLLAGSRWFQWPHHRAWLSPPVRW